MSALKELLSMLLTGSRCDAPSQQVQAISRPTKRNQSSLWHIIATTDGQLSGDSDWIHLGQDLAAVAHEQDS